MSIAVLHYSTSCYITGGDFEVTRKALAFFEHVPLFIFVFHLALGIYLRDVYFFISNTVAQLLAFYYYLGIAEAIRVERPPIFDYVLCQKPQYAVPDGLYIATISYIIVIAFGLLSMREISMRVSMLYKIGLVVVPVLYTLALLVNGYFYFWQFLINLALALVTSASYLYVYRKLIGEYNVLARERRWLKTVLGFDSDLFEQPRTKDDAMQKYI